MTTATDPRQFLHVEQWEENYLKMDRSVRSRLKRIRTVILKPGGRLLDLGCGDGIEIAALRQAGFAKVVAIDISLNLARRATGVPVVVADATRLPFRDGSFDLIYANNVLHHLVLPRFAAAADAVLAPGGALCFVEPNPSWFRTLVDIFCYSPLARLFPVLRARGIDVRQELPDYYRWMYGIDRWFAMLKARGFLPRVIKRGLFRLYSQWEKPAVAR